MGIQNLYLYTETDPNGHLEVYPASTVTFTDLSRNEDAYVYKDFGANYFDGDFTHMLTTALVSPYSDDEAYSIVWALTNDVDDLMGIDTALGDYLCVFRFWNDFHPSQYEFWLRECDGGTCYNDSYIWGGTSEKYLTIVRDESVGAFGTLYCYIYSDEERTTLLDTLSITLHTSAKDFRYLYAANTFNSGWNLGMYGYSKDYEIYGDLKPSLTQQALTDVMSTTATGNATIESCGGSAVTQHGHCWNTSGTPTTADNKTTNGAGSLGTFTSSITSLSPGTTYYFRAYATNTSGTSYSNERSMMAGDEDTEAGRGNLRIKGTDLVYVDYNDEERRANPVIVESGALAETGQNSKIFAWQNTKVSGDVLVHGVWINITTASAAAAQIDVGQTAADAASDNLIDGAVLNAVATLNNIIDAGVNGLGAVRVADDEYVTGYEDNTADPAGLVGNYYIAYTKV